LQDVTTQHSREADPADSSSPRAHHAAFLESRLTREWLSKATRIESGDSVIYYRGSAVRSSPVNERWLGTVTGDVLFLSPKQSIVVPSGTLTLLAGDRFKVTGRGRVC
jgi:hypothetical protein